MARYSVTKLILVVAVLVSSDLVAAELEQLSKAETTTRFIGGKAESAKKYSKGSVRYYTHAKLGFTVAVPINSKVIERKGTNQTSVRSRKGYVINIQAGAKRSNLPLARMATLLESKYLGEGKPWKSRDRDGQRKVSGMPAHEVVYQGTGSKTRLVVSRGKLNDYVFIFVAPANTFENLEPEFEWLLKSFKPNNADLIRRGAQGLSLKHTGLKLTDVNHFAETWCGYSIEYPKSWEVSRPAKMATMFSGREGTPDYTAIVAIQNIKPPGSKNPNDAVTRALSQLKRSLRAAVNKITVIGEKTWTYKRSSQTLIGRQLLVNYEYQGTIFQKRMIVLPRLYGTIVHVWSYTAPLSQYVRLQPQADRMLQSWTILGDANI